MLSSSASVTLLDEALTIALSRHDLLNYSVTLLNTNPVLTVSLLNPPGRVQFFKKHDYDVKYLKKCNIEIKEGKAPKEDKDDTDVKAGRRLLSRGAGWGARRGARLS